MTGWIEHEKNAGCNRGYILVDDKFVKSFLDNGGVIREVSYSEPVVDKNKRVLKF